jgi:hypothetical protein
MIPFFFYAAKVFDSRIWGEDSPDDFGIVMQRHPGSAIIAVGWMIMANFLIVHVYIAVTHEWNTNNSNLVRYWVAFSGALVLATTLVAHAATIPSGEAGTVQDSSWFHGMEAFLVGVALWVLTDVILCGQLLHRMSNADDEEEEEEEPNCHEQNIKPILVLEMLVGLIAVGLLLSAAFHGLKNYHIAWMVAVLIWAFLDCRGVEVIFDEMRVATPLDLMVYDADNDEWSLPHAVVQTINIEDEMDGTENVGRHGFLVIGNKADDENN